MGLLIFHYLMCNCSFQVPLGPYYHPGMSFHPFTAPPVNHPMYRGADVLGHQQQQVPSDEYPERPGQPECQHFVKSGFCKFGGKCKYHHPRLLMPPQPAGALSPLGLPLKPVSVLLPGMLCWFSRKKWCMLWKPLFSELIFSYLPLPIWPLDLGR